MLSIGLDDTDSRDRLCTTYLAFKLVQLLSSKGVKFVDYPYLVRLNPNVPWKTRGNGAVCLKVEGKEEDIFEEAKVIFDKYSCVGKNSNPALVILPNDSIDDDLREFSKRALHELIPRKEARILIKKYKPKIYYKGNGQGLIGALASIGMVLKDYTFELLAYRYPSKWGEPRVIYEEDVIKMDKETYPYTFNNYDYVHKRILITPHGSDPVFLGIRGERPDILLKAFNMLRIEEELEGYLIFKTNQGTGVHLEFRLDSLKPYSSGYIEGIIDSDPYTIKKGHTFFSVNGMLCAVYEPTGLCSIAQRLRKGDVVRVGGGVRKSSKNHPRVLNVEYIQILKLVEEKVLLNPLCICGKRLKSAGRGKGYKCEYCKYRCYKDKEVLTIKRDIKEGLYLPTPKSQRHLTKPLQRYGLEKYNYPQDIKLIPGWCWYNIKVAGGGLSDYLSNHRSAGILL